MSKLELMDLTPGDLQLLHKETGLKLTTAGDDLVTFKQFLYVVGKRRREDPKFTWPMSLSVPLREIHSWVDENWDLDDDENDGEDQADPDPTSTTPNG